MRRRRLKKLFKRLRELQQQDLTRDQLLLKLGAAKKDAGRAYGLVDIKLPGKDDAVTPETFGFALNRRKLRFVRRREGRYLLRSNLKGDDPALLWRSHPTHRSRAGIQGTQRRPVDQAHLPPERGPHRGAHLRGFHGLLPTSHAQAPVALAGPRTDTAGRVGKNGGLADSCWSLSPSGDYQIASFV